MSSLEEDIKNKSMLVLLSEPEYFIDVVRTSTDIICSRFNVAILYSFHFLNFARYILSGGKVFRRYILIV